MSLKKQTLIERLFKDKGWTERFYDTFEVEEALTAIMDWVDIFAEEDFDRLLKILNEFYWEGALEKAQQVSKLVTKIVSEIPADTEKIILLPIVRPDDEDKSLAKSGHMVLCEVKKKLSRRHSDRDFDEFIKPRDYVAVADPSVKSFVVGVDDFIGGGDTAKQFASNLIGETHHVESDILLASCFCTSKGAKVISDANLNRVSVKTLPKGISESQSLLPIAEYKKFMDQLENDIGYSVFYRSGFDQCEALVRLHLDTPDNTFPIFWEGGTHQPSGSVWRAPFPRTG